MPTMRKRNIVRRKKVRVSRRRKTRKSAGGVNSNKAYTRVSKFPVAERYFTRLSYVETFNFNITVASTPYQYLFRTGLFDPDVTVTGHQPYYRDQLATLYNKYRVFGIKYDIELKNTNTSALTWAYVKHSDNMTPETNFQTMVERKEGNLKSLDSSSGRTNRIRGYLSTPKCFGITKKEFYADEDFIGAIGADPTKQAYLHCYAVCSSTCLISCLIRLEFYAEFFDRIDVTGS